MWGAVDLRLKNKNSGAALRLLSRSWKEDGTITSHSWKYEQMNGWPRTANQQTQAVQSTSKWTAGSGVWVRVGRGGVGGGGLAYLSQFQQLLLRRRRGRERRRKRTQTDHEQGNGNIQPGTTFVKRFFLFFWFFKTFVRIMHYFCNYTPIQRNTKGILMTDL